MTEKKRIMCFGDSLTWGWVPLVEGMPTTRYPLVHRWTGIMATVLGEDFEIIEEGLSGRTTDLDDPFDDRLNASHYLPSALATHLPLDLVIMMLGINDTKTYFQRSSFEIAMGMSKLLGQIAVSAGGVGTAYPAPQTLLLAPPPVAKIPHPWFKNLFANGEQKSQELARHYLSLASWFGVHFLNAGEVITNYGIDGIHFSIENNADLGNAIATKVKTIFP